MHVPAPRAALVEVDPTSLSTPAREALEGVDRILVHHLPMVTRFRRVTARDGILLHGPAGWGEAAPFWDYDAVESSAWLAAAIQEAPRPAPLPVRAEVPVNVTIPVCSSEDAARRVRHSGGCTTAKVKVADPGTALAEDVERVAAVREALQETVGAAARIRVDANAAWTLPQAVEAIRALDDAAGGLEYVEQPCASVEELARVRRRVDVPIAADESIRRAEDPLAVARAGAADIAVVKVAPLGGVTRALQIAHDTGLEVVISSALESSVGLAAGVRAAAALPELRHACGLATAQLLAADVTEQPLLPLGGALAVREVAPEESLVGAHPLPDGLEERWRDRLEAMCQALLAPSAGAGRGNAR
ncbi:MAG: o-succinylbenzoate synthase [Propionibacterium sp.]|nr:o-succinylbenzoate synthase [Propionibacterium sp.]